MRSRLTLLLVVVLALAPREAPAQLMLIGNDEKVTWDDAGKPVFLPPGKDTVSIVDISSREAPRVLVSLPLMNSVFGPPTTEFIDRKSTRLNSSHDQISYAVFCLKKKKQQQTADDPSCP